MFDKLLDSSPVRAKNRKSATLAFSVALHGTALLSVFMAPLFLQELLPQVDLLTYVASPPPAEAAFPTPAVKTPPAEAPPPSAQSDKKPTAPPDSNAEPQIRDTVEDFDRKAKAPAPENTSGVAGGNGDGDYLGSRREGTAGLIVPNGGETPPPSRQAASAPPPSSEPPHSAPVPVVLASRLLNRVEPAYPELARKIHLQGAVILKIVVDVQGAVRQVTVISGHPLLAPAAAAAVWKWTYTPTTLNGFAVEVEGTVVVNFSLR